jgi:hypothetical protein
MTERKREEEEESLDPDFEDEDVEAVSKVFAAFSQAVQENKGKLQIIVLDHARERVWQNIQYIHYVDEWRHGKKLVPSAWLPNNTDGASLKGTLS